MKKLDLSNLEKKGTQRINWEKSIGRTIPFICNDITGELLIINHDKVNHKTLLRYKDKEQWFSKVSIDACNIERFVGYKKEVSQNFKYNIGQNIINNKQNFIIIDRKFEHKQYGEKLKYYRMYKCSCKICGGEVWINEYSLKKGVGCSCCHGRTIIKGINSIGDIKSELIQYFILPEYAFQYSIYSNKKIPMRCPVCGELKLMSCYELNINGFYCSKCRSIANKRPDLLKYLVNKSDGIIATGSDFQINVRCPDCNNTYKVRANCLCYYGIRCKFCSDGISYGEKFIHCLLIQCDESFKTQINHNDFEWVGKFRYDIYLQKQNAIIEIHGNQHYSNIGFWSKGGRALEDELVNDETKKELAINNGIDNYIIIDARYSKMNYIKNSVLNNIELNKLINIKNVDWNKCNEFATKSMIKTICNIWTNENLTIQEISNQHNLSRKCIRNYLKTGAELGWCNYDPKQSIKRSYQIKRV